MSVPAPLQALKVLLVEADPIIRRSLTLILKSRGAGVLAVHSATEALEAISQFKPNLYIINLRLPREDGRSLIRKIRALSPEQGGNIPAIALSSSMFESEEQPFIEGFQAQLTQPISLEKLLNIIMTLVCQSSSDFRFPR